jgi:hypothetical protein
MIESGTLIDTMMGLLFETLPLDETTTTDTQTRFLRHAGSDLRLSPAFRIAWYCLLVAVACPLFSCVLWCWYQRYRGHRRALDALERESQLSRIEANIQAFSEAEKVKRARLIHSAIQEQVKKVTKADLKKMRKPQEDEEEQSNYSCSICLEDFRLGDSVAKSSDSMCCHCYHEECIISWLVARQHAFCPYCRRPFLCLPAKTSIASHDLTTLDDMESTSRMESSVIAGLDDRTVADALESDALDVVLEDVDVPTDDEETKAGIEMEQR